MSLSLLQPFHKRHHGCVHLLLCLNPMWQLRSCHSTSKLSHLCHCVIQLCQNNIICASCPSLAIAHMFINIESSNRFVPEQTKKSHLSKLVSNKSMHEVCLFSLMDGLVGCWGKNKSWRDKGSVWALWSAGGLWHVFAQKSQLFNEMFESRWTFVEDFPISAPRLNRFQDQCWRQNQRKQQSALSLWDIAWPILPEFGTCFYDKQVLISALCEFSDPTQFLWSDSGSAHGSSIWIWKNGIQPCLELKMESEIDVVW